MEKIFICCLSISVILGIICLFAKFNLVILGSTLVNILLLYFAVREQRLKKKRELLVNILWLYFAIREQRLKKKIEDDEKNQKKNW